jgi:hypothetical protein
VIVSWFCYSARSIIQTFPRFPLRKISPCTVRKVRNTVRTGAYCTAFVIKYRYGTGPIAPVLQRPQSRREPIGIQDLNLDWYCSPNSYRYRYGT